MKPEWRLRLDVKTSIAHFIYPPVTKSFSMVVSSIQKYKAVCWQTQNYLYIHKAYKHQSYRMEQVKGWRTTACTVAAGISHTVKETRQQDSSFGLWGFLPRPPLLLTKFSQCPQQLSRAGRNQCVLFPFLSLFIHQTRATTDTTTKSSNNCTKNKGTVINNNKK